MINLGDLPGGNDVDAQAFALNNLGHVAGYGHSAWGGSANEAFLWTAETGLVGLGDLPGREFFSVGHGINDSDQVVGESISANGPNGSTSYEAFLWDPQHGMIGLGDLAGSQFYSVAYDVNNAGQVVGVSRSSQRGLEAFIWDAQNGMRDLGQTGDGSFAYWATSINELGQVAGAAVVRNYFYPHPFIWRPAEGFTFMIIGGGPARGVAHDVNELGQVVGTGGADETQQKGFIWDAVNGLRWLNNLVDAASWRRYGRIYEAVSINNRGQIGVNILGQAAILTPFVLADMNCDGSLNSFDIQPFVLTLQWLSGDDDAREEYENTYPGCHGDWAADANQDGSVNQFDIQPFIDLLSR